METIRSLARIVTLESPFKQIFHYSQTLDSFDAVYQFRTSYLTEKIIGCTKPATYEEQIDQYVQMQKTTSSPSSGGEAHPANSSTSVLPVTYERVRGVIQIEPENPEIELDPSGSGDVVVRWKVSLKFIPFDALESSFVRGAENQFGSSPIGGSAIVHASGKLKVAFSEDKLWLDFKIYAATIRLSNSTGDFDKYAKLLMSNPLTRLFAGLPAAQGSQIIGPKIALGGELQGGERLDGFANILSVQERYTQPTNNQILLIGVVANSHASTADIYSVRPFLDYKSNFGYVLSGELIKAGVKARWNRDALKQYKNVDTMAVFNVETNLPINNPCTAKVHVEIGDLKDVSVSVTAKDKSDAVQLVFMQSTQFKSMIQANNDPVRLEGDAAKAHVEPFAIWAWPFDPPPSGTDPLVRAYAAIAMEMGGWLRNPFCTPVWFNVRSGHISGPLDLFLIQGTLP